MSKELSSTTLAPGVVQDRKMFLHLNGWNKGKEPSPRESDRIDSLNISSSIGNSIELMDALERGELILLPTEK